MFSKIQLLSLSTTAPNIPVSATKATTLIHPIKSTKSIHLLSLLHEFVLHLSTNVFHVPIYEHLQHLGMIMIAFMHSISLIDF